MKRLVLFALLLTLGVPYLSEIVSGYGSVNLTELNTSLTNYNITFYPGHMHEIVWIEAPRKINLTSATWTMIGHKSEYYPHSDQEASYSTPHPWDVVYPSTNTVDEDWTTFGQCQGGGTCYLYENFTIPYQDATTKTKAYSVSKLSRFANGDDCEIHYFNYNDHTWDILYANPTCGDFSNHEFNVTLEIPYNGLNETFYQMRTTIKASGGLISRYWESKIVFYNVTSDIVVDTLTDGERDFTQTVEKEAHFDIRFFNASQTADLNYTGITKFLLADSVVGWEETDLISFNISSNSSGILELSNISLFGQYLYGYFNILIYDEMTGGLFNTSDMTLTLLCTDDIQNQSITNHTTLGVWVDCDLNMLKLDVDNGSVSHWRTLKPVAGYNLDVEFYMINQNSWSSVFQDWLIFDMPGDFDNGSIQITKPVPGVNVKTMIEQDIDAEAKVLLWLIIDQEYTLTAISADGSVTRNVGGLIVDSDEDKTLTISEVEFNPGLTLIMNSVYYQITSDADAAYIRFYYNDTLDQTSLVEVYVYNASNITQLMYSDTSTSSNAIFTYNAVDINDTYIAEMYMTHTTFGQIRHTLIVGFGPETSVHLVNFERMGLENWYAIMATMVIIFTILVFSRANEAMAFGVVAIEIIMFWTWGWFKEYEHALTTGVILLVVILMALNYMQKRRAGQL